MQKKKCAKKRREIETGRLVPPRRTGHDRDTSAQRQQNQDIAVMATGVMSALKVDNK